MDGFFSPSCTKSTHTSWWWGAKLWPKWQNKKQKQNMVGVFGPHSADERIPLRRIWLDWTLQWSLCVLTGNVCAVAPLERKSLCWSLGVTTSLQTTCTGSCPGWSATAASHLLTWGWQFASADIFHSVICSLPSTRNKCKLLAFNNLTFSCVEHSALVSPHVFKWSQQHTVSDVLYFLLENDAVILSRMISIR